MNLNTNILSDLKSQGYKQTKVRQALIEILLENNSPLSIADILEELSKKGLTPNKTTVYREITFLKDIERVVEVDFGEGKKMYEIKTSHHHHIVCINCKKVEDFPMEEDLDQTEKKILQKMGYKPVGHSLEFFGLCTDCQ